MARHPQSGPSKAKPRSIIGFSLSPALASKVKAEAGRRQIKLKKLFEEMWALYEKRAPKDNS
jgi:hypothetical protein